MSRTSVAKALAKLRERSKVSITVAAKRADVSRTVIYSWEGGETSPRGDNIEALLAAYGFGWHDFADAVDPAAAAARQSGLEESLADPAASPPPTRGAFDSEEFAREFAKEMAGAFQKTMRKFTS